MLNKIFNYSYVNKHIIITFFGIRIKLKKNVYKFIKPYHINFFINGNNNKVVCIYNNKQYTISQKTKNIFFQIQGNNNNIIFETDKVIKKLPKGIEINIKGNNNYIKIKNPRFSNSQIYMKGDYNKFELGKTVKNIDGGHFFIENGGECYIENDCELGNSMLWCVVNGDLDGEHHKLFIGEGTHIAKDAIIRTSDGECIIDNTGKPISQPQDVIINKHCWITSRCIILKGAYLPEGTIVAANSLVNKTFSEKNCLIAGSPAEIKKKNIHWLANSYGRAMKEYLENNQSSSCQNENN